MKKTILLKHICLIVFGILFSFGADAAMYKWTDEDGNTHYTESPPPEGIEGSTISPPPKVDVESAQKALEKQQKKVESYSEAREKRAEEQAKKEAELELDKKNCEIARSNAASLERPRVNLQDEQGNVYKAPEEERLEKLQKAREDVTKYCR